MQEKTFQGIMHPINSTKFLKFIKFCKLFLKSEKRKNGLLMW